MFNMIDWFKGRRRDRPPYPPGPAPLKPEAYERIKIMRRRLRHYDDPSVPADQIANYHFGPKGGETVFRGTRDDIDERLTRSIDAYETWNRRAIAFDHWKYAQRQLQEMRHRDAMNRMARRQERWERIMARIGRALLLLLKILGIALLVAVAVCLMWIPELTVGFVGLGMAIDRTMRDGKRY